MSRRPPIRAANLLPLAVKFIAALTGYRRSRPRRARLYKTCVIYKLPYGIKERMPGYVGMQMWAERWLMFLWILFYCLGIPRLLRAISWKRDKSGKSVQCWGKCCGKTFKKRSLEGIQNKLGSQWCDEKCRSFNFVVIKFYFPPTALQTRIHKGFILFAFAAQYLPKMLPYCE